MKDFIIPDRDFGTPAAKSKVMVTLNVDGFDVTVPEGHQRHARGGRGGDLRAEALRDGLASMPSAPAACVWSRSRGGRARPPPAPRRWRPG